MENSVRDASWMVICTVLVLVLIQFDTLATENLLNYGLIYRGLIWLLTALMALKALGHFGNMYADWRDAE